MSDTKNCQICLEDINVGSIVDLSCGHYYCIDCLRRYIDGKIYDLDDEIYCPDRWCYEYIPNDTIETIIGDESFNKFNDMKTKQDFLKYSQCPECQQICWSNSNYMECENCSHSFCRICKDDPHNDDEECPNKEEIDNEIEEIYNAIDADEDLKQCPICNILIEKDPSTCNSIKCKYCKTKFCWVCLLTSNQVRKLNSHNCDGYRGFHSTESDDEYNDGPEV